MIMRKIRCSQQKKNRQKCSAINLKTFTQNTILLNQQNFCWVNHRIWSLYEKKHVVDPSQLFGCFNQIFGQLENSVN